MTFLSMAQSVRNDCTTKNLTGVAEQLVYEFNVGELMDAAESNNVIIRKYTKLNRILKRLCNDKHITRAVAESVDHQMGGRLSDVMNMAGFTSDPSQVGYVKVKRLLGDHLLKLARTSACADNYEITLENVSKERLGKAVRLLEMIGARREVDKRFQPMQVNGREIVSNILKDIGVDEDSYSDLNDEGILDLLGHPETRMKFRTDVKRLRTNAKRNLKIIQKGTALESEILTTGSDLKITRAFARFCSNMIKIVPDL